MLYIILYIVYIYSIHIYTYGTSPGGGGPSVIISENEVIFLWKRIVIIIGGFMNAVHSPFKGTVW